MRELPTPLCAVCGKPVDEVITWIDPNRDTQVFIARCHGDEERCELTPFDLVSAGPHLRLRPGVAFKTKQLANPPKPPRT